MSGPYLLIRLRGSEMISLPGPPMRDEMPESSLPVVEEINQNPEFAAREISKDEFEAIWRQATRLIIE
jgi:hypothetical protein